VAVVGYFAFLGAGRGDSPWFALDASLAGRRHTTVFENPGMKDPHELRTRLDLPVYGGDPVQLWWED
jgi:hypothetical protein